MIFLHYMIENTAKLFRFVCTLLWFFIYKVIQMDIFNVNSFQMWHCVTTSPTTKLFRFQSAMVSLSVWSTVGSTVFHSTVSIAKGKRGQRYDISTVVLSDFIRSSTSNRTLQKFIYESTIYIYIYACMHACMHACIHTYIHTYNHHHCAAIVFHDWAKASACCFHICLSCAILCQMEPFKFTSTVSPAFP